MSSVNQNAWAFTVVIAVVTFAGVQIALQLLGADSGATGWLIFTAAAAAFAANKAWNATSN